MTPKHKTTREEKIAYTLRMLNSDKDGDVLAAVYALKRLLQSLGTDWDGLASGFEKILNGSDKAITQAEMQKAISDAYAAGVQDTENKLHGGDDFQSADGKPPWESIALFLQRNKNRLPARNHEFVDKMAAQAVLGQRAERTAAQVPTQPVLPTWRKNYMSVQIDEAAVRQFIEIINDHVKAAINGASSAGVLQICRINPLDESVVPSRIPPWRYRAYDQDRDW